MPTVSTQFVQRVGQRGFVAGVLDSERPATVPLPMRIADRFRPLRWLAARAIGLGIRPEYEAPAPAPLTADR